GVTVNGGSNNLGVVYGGPITPGTNTTQIMCTNVPAAASSGVAIGSIVSGQAYSYTASGCVCVNCPGSGNAFDDPNGNEHTNSLCTGPTTSFLADGTFTCPG